MQPQAQQPRPPPSAPVPQPKPISLKFGSDDAKDVFARYICDRIESGVNDRRSGGFNDEVLLSREQYDGTLPEKNLPWIGCSNLNVPFSRPIADTLHAHIYKTLTGVEPYFTEETPRSTDQDQADVLTEFLQWKMKTDIDFPAKLDEAILRLLTDKIAVVSPYWEVEIKKQRSYEPVTPALRQELAAAGMLDQIDGYPDGSWATVTRRAYTKNCATWRIIDVLNFATYPGAVGDLSEAMLMGHRDWRRAGDLRAGVAAGRYDKLAVERLLEKPPTGIERHNEWVGGDQARWDEEGILIGNELTNAEMPYEVWQVLVKWDEDKDGEDELCLCEVAINERILLSAMRYPYYHDDPFYCVLCLYPKPGHLYGYSSMELLSNHQDFLNALWNQRMDRGTLEISAPVVARTGLKRDIGGNTIAPNTVLFDDNPKDALVPMPLGTGINRPLEDVQWAMQQGYSIAGVNETTQAQGTGDKTLGVTERELGFVNMKFDVGVDRIRRALARATAQTVALLAQYMPTDETFALTAGTDVDGNPLFKALTREILNRKTSFVPQGTSAMSNPAVREQIAEKQITQAKESPFIQANLRRQWELESRWQRAVGEKNPTALIGTAQQAEKMQEDLQNQPPAPPETKITITERADEVATLAGMLKRGETTEEEYLNAAILAAQAAHMMPTPPQGAKVGDATDDAAGYEAGSRGTPPQPDGSDVAPQRRGEAA